MISTTLKFSLVFILLFIGRVQTIEFLMQGPDSPDGDEDPYPEGAPIDDHLFVLFIAGLLLGVYFVLKRKHILNVKS
ncbi:hypothetical protein J2X31_000701 [Flavobacterium arsenatis]|uniref:Signal peptidase n=1 Tax=Flavobacterium arsenatis TaxID=1484332 RepID=A0ABU1TL49_9FLAO|nr:hypothetical protein [Flavobacterium arsenatis]MDR6966703.1 hypothetical protein [Flavobacterium arsenatis]